MPVDIQNVLVCDAVDESCIQLLKLNGIKVWQTALMFKLFDRRLHSYTQTQIPTQLSSGSLSRRISPFVLNAKSRMKGEKIA